MSETAFDDLIGLLRSALKRVIYNSRSKQPIFVELVVAIGLRWLADGSYQEIEDVFGVSTTEAYRSRNKFIDALLNCDQLQIRLPTTVTEWEELRKLFESKNSEGVINDAKKERLRQQSNGLLLRTLRALWRELSRDM